MAKNGATATADTLETTSNPRQLATTPEDDANESISRRAWRTLEDVEPAEDKPKRRGRPRGSGKRQRAANKAAEDAPAVAPLTADELERVGRICALAHKSQLSPSETAEDLRELVEAWDRLEAQPRQE